MDGRERSFCRLAALHGLVSTGSRVKCGTMNPNPLPVLALLPSLSYAICALRPVLLEIVSTEGAP